MCMATIMRTVLTQMNLRIVSIAFSTNFMIKNTPFGIGGNNLKLIYKSIF